MRQSIIVNPGSLRGTVMIPPSKSHTLRAILFAALAKGSSTISNPLESPDAAAMINACCLLGAGIEQKPGKLHVEGLGRAPNGAEDIIHSGNSGLVFRFLTALGALSTLPIVITGDHSIRHQRPITPLLEGMRQLGAEALSLRGDGLAPVLVRGPLRPGKTTVLAQDSQFISALLIASLFVEGPVEIHARDPGEKPWVGLTLDWLDRLALPYQQRDYEWYRVEGPFSIQPFSYSVPGDFSSALFPIVAALLTDSELTLKRLNFSDSQGDKRAITWLQQMGARVELDGEELKVHRGGRLKGSAININDCIDAITPLAVVACIAEGETCLYGAGVARSKECDRVSATARELTKMGAVIEEFKDGLLIRQSELRGSSELFSHHDHRLAMSLICAALGARGKSQISGTQCIQKTFPTFVETFKKIGAVFEVKECS